MTQVDTGNALSKRYLILHLLVAVCAGGLSHLSFAPFEFQFIAPIAIAILYGQLTLLKSLSIKNVIYLGLSFGFGLFISGLRWVHVSLDTFGGLPLAVTLGLVIFLALYLALYSALAAYAFAKLKRQTHAFNALLFAALWCLSEYCRGEILTGFPWLWLGYSQTSGIISQAAASVGVLGLSFILVLMAALTVNLIQAWRSNLTLLLLCVGAVYGLTTINTIKPNGEVTTLALIQGNIEQSAKWQQEAMWPTISRYMELTRQNFDADIIIWPEAAMPAVEAWIEDYLHGIDQEALRHQSAVVTGVISRESIVDGNQVQQKHYNALITLGQHTALPHDDARYKDRHSNRYYKHQLLPFGEFVPFEEILRPLAPLFNLPQSSFTRGDAVQPNLSAKGVNLAPAICYEIAFSELVRQNVTPDTDFILTVSNDAWFGRSIGPHQHMQLAQMRAIEVGRPVVRVTNNGITAVVDSQGKIVAKLNQFEEAVLRTEVTSVSGLTYFYRYGHAPVLWLSALLFALALYLKRRAKD